MGGCRLALETAAGSRTKTTPTEEGARRLRECSGMSLDGGRRVVLVRPYERSG